MNQNIKTNLHNMLTNLVENGTYTGLAVGIVKDDEILFAGEYGTADISTGDAVVPSTLFHQASVSKTFVAMAVMQLVENGVVELDEPLINYLPYFEMEDERYGDITIRQLLSHTSGMPDEEDYAWDRPEFDEQSLERYVKSIAPRKLLTEPGCTFAYSNIGFEILGDVIAKVSGMSFEQYMKENILEPAGMKSSSFLKQEIEANLAAPHVRKADGSEVYVSEVFPYNRAHAPSSTLYTNVEDMCQCMLMHLNQGAENGIYNALKSSSYAEMWKPQASIGEEQESGHIGLSWFLGEHKGIRTLSHSGWDTGFLSDLFILPDNKIAFIVMTNGDYNDLSSVTFPLLDLLRDQ
ncbi:serine hydrolase domain-containing protein [Paenibacillus gorillae]|uniref:serine hydrolase domain-containing protein n=1 Tax=Paenibacillus gorillae TaxID=1243662 RepID=UPI0004B47E97|nr:serine hydrolase [Paenibacillus gorillae]